MRYKQCIENLQQLATKKGINYSLEKLNPVLKKLNNPHLSLPPTIHIAGTNGKGSTTAFLRSLSLAHNISVITFTSPHLESYCERIMYNNSPISHETFCDLFECVFPFLDVGLTEFEVLTLMALLYCTKTKPDLCVFEVGLGGRLDATNVIQPKCTIITHIDYDHQQFLGNTLSKIAAEKAGIIKPKIPCYTPSQQHPEVQSVLSQKAKENNTTLHFISPLDKSTTSWQLSATYQKENASLALAAFKYLFKNSDINKLYSGLSQAQHWGRFTQITTPSQKIIIDAAHNPSGLKQLDINLDTISSYKDRIIIFGLHKFKDPSVILPLITQLAPKCYYCEFDSEFALSYNTIKSASSSEISQFHLNQPLPKAKLIIFTGSIYFIGKFYNQNQLLHVSKKTS